MIVTKINLTLCRANASLSNMVARTIYICRAEYVLQMIVNPAHYSFKMMVTEINLTLCRMNAYQRWWLKITVICAVFFTNDSDEDDQPAHYSGDVGCPAGLQGVAAPCCVDYVLLL